jgi:hypothetical protein
VSRDRSQGKPQLIASRFAVLGPPRMQNSGRIVANPEVDAKNAVHTNWPESLRHFPGTGLNP